jgi:hypothetical protein
MRALSGDAKGRRCASHGKGRESQDGKCSCIIVSITSPTVHGSAAHVQTKRDNGHIEPREDAEGAEENLGLDDIPRVRMVEWILLATCEERIRGRSLMKVEREGQER